MLTPRTTLTRRVLAALDATPSRIPVLLGGCGSGKTSLVQLVRDRLPRGSTQYINVERTATTPERFLRSIVAASPMPVTEPAGGGARGAFGALLSFFSRAKTGGGGAGALFLSQ